MMPSLLHGRVFVSAGMVCKNLPSSFAQFSKSMNSWAKAIKMASDSAATPNSILTIFSEMRRQSVPVDSFSILFVLKSCTRLREPGLIRHLHCHVIKVGLVRHVYVASSLLHAYVVASFECASNLFDEIPDRNAVTWNTMIAGHARRGDVAKSRELFDEMPRRDVASWSAMIAGYVNNGDGMKGLLLFREMMVVPAEGGLVPDQVTVCSVLSGCVRMGKIGLLLGRAVHGYVVRNAWELNVEIGTVLVDMYAKCGSLQGAQRLFEAMEDRNVMTWTALICGSAQHGFGKEVLRLFEVMLDFGVKPNELTFTGVLSACMNSGLVEEGKMYFQMIQECGLELKVHHYGCMVELFGRMGMLKEALEMIEDMKVEPNVVMWGSYLSACRQHKRFDMAERVIERILGMIKPENDGGVYTLICDVYSLSEKWDDAERVRQLMLDQKVRKVRGSSSVESRRSLLARGPSVTNSYRRLLSGESDDEQTILRKKIFSHASLKTYLPDGDLT